MSIKRRMMDLGQRNSIGHHRMTQHLVSIRDNVRGIEQACLRQSRHGTSAPISLCPEQTLI